MAFGRKKEESRPAAPVAGSATAAAVAEAEQFDIAPADYLAAVAKLKGRPAPVAAVPVPVSELYPISAGIAAAEHRKEEALRKAREEAIKNPTLGQEIPGEGGVSAGTWQPKGLSQKFHVVAAPEDLTDESGKKGVFKYVEALKRLANLKGWHGHNGTNFATDKDLYKALEDVSYLREGAGWFIPPRELLTGTEPDGPSGVRKGKIIQPDNLYSLKDTGKLAGTFCTAAARGSDCPVWYWSSTEDRDDPSFMWNADFSDGYEGRYRKDYSRLSCRPVRLVPVVGP